MLLAELLLVEVLLLSVKTLFVFDPDLTADVLFLVVTFPSLNPETDVLLRLEPTLVLLLTLFLESVTTLLFLPLLLVAILVVVFLLPSSYLILVPVDLLFP